MYTNSMDCPFCQIAENKVTAHKVYEDDFTVAFLDIHPIREGHLLVIPKNHQADFYKLDSDSYTNLMNTVKKMATLVDNTFHPHKVGIIVAGWDVPHTHIHVVPMHDYHDITSKALLEGERANPNEDELEKTLQHLQEHSVLVGLLD
jgi:histidine triad (HIT) family protein